MRAKLPNQEGLVDRDGVRIHYEVYGDGPETILFIAPWAIVHARSWKAQIPWFSDHFRCLTYDPRGNGKSDRPDRMDAYALEHYVNDALAVLDATQTRSAILVGLSLGGLIASILAAHHSARTRAAVLIDALATIGPGYPYLTPQHFETRRHSFEGWDKYNREYWLSDYEDFARFFLGTANRDPHSTKQLEDALEWAAQTDGQTLAHTIAARTIRPSFDVGEQMYRSIRCPLLVIHNTGDPIQPIGRDQSQHAAELVTLLHKIDFIAELGQGARCTQACGSAAQDGHLLAIGFRRRKLGNASVPACKLDDGGLYLGNVDGPVKVLAGAGRHAESIGADKPTASPKRIVPHDFAG